MLEELRDALNNLILYKQTVVVTNDILHEFLPEFLKGEQCAIEETDLGDGYTKIVILP